VFQYRVLHIYLLFLQEQIKDIKSQLHTQMTYHPALVLIRNDTLVTYAGII
jgi:hypothetical protein